MENQGWLHDLIMFLTAVFAAYAAYRGRENGKAVDEVKKQVDGHTGAVVRAEASAARVEGVLQGISLAQQTPPVGPPK